MLKTLERFAGWTSAVILIPPLYLGTESSTASTSDTTTSRKTASVFKIGGMLCT
jgi:hypothetical protein